VPLDVPATAAAQALHIIADLAITSGLAGPLLLNRYRPAGPARGLFCALIPPRRDPRALARVGRVSDVADEPETVLRDQDAAFGWLRRG
jgi:hypothetical protein